MPEVDNRILVDPTKIAYAVFDGEGHIRYMSNDKLKCRDNITQRGWEGKARVNPVAIQLLKEIVTFEKL